MVKKVISGVVMIIFIACCFLLGDFDRSQVGLATTPNMVTVTDHIPIFTFHRLVPDYIKNKKYSNNQWVGSIDVFATMMEYLYNNGYETISTEEFYEWYIGERECNNKTVMITFDDGFYEDYYLALPILKKYGFKATSFVVGSRIKDITRKYDRNVTAYIGLDVIEEVRRNYPNFEFQSHSYNMHYYTKNGKHRIRSMSEEDMIEDVEQNKEYNFTTMAYPYGDYNNKIKRVLENAGYLVAFRFGPSEVATRDSDRFAIPRIKINGKATLATLKKWLN